MAAKTTFSELKKRIGALDSDSARTGRKDEAAPEVAGFAELTLGFTPLDALLPRGAKSHGVHQFACARPGDPAAPLSFACALMSRAMGENRHALVVREAGAVRETGPLYPPGLQALGLDPGRVALAEASDGEGALRIVDEALRASAAPVLLLDLRDHASLADLRITRRFNLAARPARAIVLLVTPNLEATSAALTRWSVACEPSVGRKRRLGSPMFQIALTRNRLGPTGVWVGAWNVNERAFAPSKALVAPVVRPPVHRPYPADALANDGAVWAYRSAG